MCVCVRHSNEKFNKPMHSAVFHLNPKSTYDLVLSVGLTILWPFHSKTTNNESNQNVCIPNFTDTNIVHSTIQSQRYVGIIFTNRLVESGCGLYTTCDTFETLNLIIFAQTSEKNTERETEKKGNSNNMEKEHE